MINRILFTVIALISAFSLFAQKNETIKKAIKYDPKNLQSFDVEWGIHKKSKEWWYATGFVEDEQGNLYSFQYTLLHLNMGIATPKIAMVAFTDFKNNVHHYRQEKTTNKKEIIINEKEATYLGVASAKKEPNGMRIEIKHKNFSLSVFAEYGKGAFWHCDNGLLQMGLQGKKETTFYYSYTNMPTTGTVKYNNQTLNLKGKTWFDKQGGTYSIMDRRTHWEWFSLRFHDDEEMMLFAFPQSNYIDGTYITKDGKSSRLNNYTLKTTKYIEKNGKKWSTEWEVTTPGLKDEYYKIVPISEGNMNFAYFEQLCRIINKEGNEVGLCFVELLPGVLNEGKIASKDLFKKIEY